MFMWKNTLLCCSVELVWPYLCVLVLQYLCIQGYLLQCKLIKISSGQLLVQRSASMYYLYETHVTKKVGTTFGIRSFLFRAKCKSRTIWSSSKCAVVGWKCTQLGVIFMFSCSLLSKKKAVVLLKLQWPKPSFVLFLCSFKKKKQNCNVMLAMFLCYVSVISAAAHSCSFHLDNPFGRNKLSHSVHFQSSLTA